MRLALWAAALLAAAPICGLVGCQFPSARLCFVHGKPQFVAPWNSRYVERPERLDQGYTIILPGSVGGSDLDHGLVTGLKQADVPTAIELVDWTPSQFLVAYNMMAYEHNCAVAGAVAAKIVAYQERYPGRPVYLIGYSGGGGVAVLALERLPQNVKITKTVLLAPTISNDYDLRNAARHSERGIANFYSPLDAPILMVLGTAVGMTDGRHALPAGAIGFQTPSVLKTESDKKTYTDHLSQHPYDVDMLLDGHVGGHFSWVNPSFVAKHVAPLVGGDRLLR